jgi:gliding motility-associated-like protein
MKKLLLFLLVLSGVIHTQAQTITPVYFNNTATYFPGGSISFHFKPTGNFPIGTSYTLQLMDASGSTVINPNIGSVSEFFVPVLNGTLPDGLTTGTYSLRAVASNGTISPVSSAFSVQATPAFAKPVLDTTNSILGVNCYKGDKNIFGFIDKGINAVSTSLNFTLATTPGAIYTAKLIRNTNSPSTNLGITNLSISTLFTPYTVIIPGGLQTDYYTVELTKTIGGISSSYSYVYLFNTGGTSLGNTSSENVCVSETVNFSIDQSIVAKNYPGSVYTLNYGDGSPTQTYTHSQFITQNLSHVYTSPTCSDPTANDGKYKIQLFLYNKGIKVSGNNNCDSLIKNGNGTTKFVNISKAPIAHFRVDSFHCINNALLLLNQTISGAYGTSNVCETQSIVNWFIKSPSAADYAQVPSSWLVGPNNDLQIPENFLNQAGVWNIILTAQNPEGCTIVNSDTRSFCVEPKPVPDFSMNMQSSLSGCTPLVVTTTNLTNTNICRGYVFNWQILHSNTSTAATLNIDYTISPNASVEAPVITFLRPGDYIIRLNTVNSCGIFFKDHTVSIQQNAQANLPEDKRHCGLQTIDFATNVFHKPVYNTNAGTEKYQWTISPGTYTLMGGTNLNQAYPQVRFDQFTTYTISLQFINDCDTATTSQRISFDAPVSSYAGSDSTICYNTSSIPVVATATGPISTGVWTTSGNGSFVNGNTPAAVYTLGDKDKTALSVTLTYTVTPPAGSACPPNIDSRIITILPENKITNGTPISVCSGSSLGYTPTATFSPGTFRWTSTVLSGAVSGNTSGTGNSIGDLLVNNSAQIVAEVSYTVWPVFDGCEGTPSTFVVTVKPAPVLNSFTTIPPSTCSSATGSISLTGLAVSGLYTIQYSKNGTPALPVSILSSSAGVVTITNLTAGLYDNITVTLDGCQSNSIGPITLADPNPPGAPAASSNGPICSGNTLMLEAAQTTPGTITYAWTGPNGYFSTEQNPTISNATAAHSGTYFVTATLNGCTSTAGSVTVVINQTPLNVTVDSNSPVCVGSPINLNASSATPGAVFTWSGPNGFTSILPNPVIPNASSAHVGSYSVIVGLGSCSAAAVSTSVAVTTLPGITSTSFSDPTSCNLAMGNISLHGLASSTTYEVSYTKAGGAITTVTLTSSPSGIVVIPALGAGSYADISVSINGCPSNIVGPVVLTDPTPPAMPSASSNGPICSGNNLQLMAESATPGITYSWTGPAGFTSNTQNPVIAGATTAASGVYTVTTTLNNCTAFTTLTVTVNQTPIAPSVITPVPYCQGEVPAALHAGVNAGNELLWYSTATGGVGSAVAPTPSTNVVGITSYYVSQRNPVTNCESERSLIQVVVKATPVINSSSFTSPMSCATPTGTITLNGLEANTTYTVHYTKAGMSSAVAASSNATGTIVITGLSAGTYTNIYVTLFNCASASVGPFMLADPNPPLVPVAGSNSPVCAGATLTLTATSATPGAVTYSWSSANGFVSNLQSPSILNVPVSASGTYFVTATLNNCTSQPATLLVDVQAAPAAPTASSSVPYCIDAIAAPLTATATTGNNLLWYTVAAGGVPSGVAPTPQTAVAGTTTYYVSQQSPLGCESPRTAINVVTNPDAKAVYNYTIDTSCAPFHITASIIQPVQFPDRNSLYEWYADGQLIGTGTSFPGFLLANPNDSVTIKLRTISALGCKEDSLKHTFYTIAVPMPSFNVNTLEGCGPLLVQVTNTTPQSGLFGFTWDFGNGQTSDLTNPAGVVYAPNPTFGDTTYTITLSAKTVCNTVQASKIIRVKSKPKAVFAPDKTFGCSPMTVVFANQSLGLNATYTWDFGDGSPLLTTAVRGPQTHIYSTAVRDTFYAKLITSNDCGNDTAQYAIVVSPNPIQLHLTVNGTQLFGCVPHTVTFFNNSAGATSFFWNFGDGNTMTTTSNVGTVNHTYLNAGTYIVQLRATNGCSDTLTTKTITVFPTPTASFTVNRSVLCLGDTLRTGNTSLDATRYEWAFGDGTVSTLAAPTHVYAAPGSYTITLRTYRLNPQGNECVNSTTASVTVTTTATGSFTATPDNGNCAPLDVSFANTTLPSVSATWNFGDGTTGIGNTINHRFATAGTYSVTLTTVVPGGCTYVTTQTITVTGPSGQFLYTSGYNCSTPARFEVIAANTDSVTWHFGDGTSRTSKERVVFHTYQNPGAYLPHVTLNTITGCRVALKGMDSIRVDRITIGFAQTIQRFCGSTTVNFKDTSSAFYSKTSAAWDFGDNTTGTGLNASHTYSISGDYDVKLTIISSSGCTKTITKRVTVLVNNVPVATITAPATGCVGQPVTFTGASQSTDPVSFIKWTTSTGVTSNSNPFHHNFTLPGTYTVQLIVGTANGCFDTTNLHTIVINPSPAIIASNDLTLCRGNSATISATGGLQYNWAPSQGLSCTTCPNPIASPLLSTRYKVQGTNAFGCSVIDSVDVFVAQPFTVSVSANDSICIGESSNLLASGATTYIWTGNSLSSNVVANPVATPALTTRYLVVGHDAFNCFTDTAEVIVAVGKYPTVNLGPDLTLPTGTVQPMKTVVTNGPIHSWLWTPATDLSCATCALPSATIKKDVTYSVKVTTEYGCSASDTIAIKTFCNNAQAFVPNAFTPDGDGINDILMVRGSGIAQVKTFRVFNRWGEVVFERGNFSPNNPTYGWDGKIKGVVGPPDVYVYTAEVICENGTSYTYKGNVSVLK